MDPAQKPPSTPSPPSRALRSRAPWAWGLLPALAAGLLLASPHIPALAGLPVRFGPSEYFAATVFLAVCGAMMGASQSLPKALGMLIAGLLAGMVGTDPASGTGRFTLGLGALEDGIAPLAAGAGAFGIGALAAATTAPGSRAPAWRRTLGPLAVATCVALFEPWGSAFYTLLIAGVFSYAARQLGCPVWPMLCGMALAPAMEENLRRALLLAHGDWGALAARPLTAGLLGATAAIALTALWSRAARR